MAIQRRALYLAFPLFACFVLFYLLPFLYSLYYSVIKSAFDLRFVGLDNYVQTVTNPYYRLALGNTILMFFICVPILITLSLLIAFIMKTLPSAGYFRAAFVLPMLVPSVAIVLVFQMLFLQPNSVLRDVRMLGSGAETRIPLLAIFIWKNLGFHVIVFLSALEGIPAQIWEASELDGARGVRRFWSITLPLLVPALLFCCIWATAQSLRIFKEAYLLYGAYPHESVYLLQHYINNHFFKLNYQRLTTAATMLALMLLVVVVFVFVLQRKRQIDVW